MTPGTGAAAPEGERRTASRLSLRLSERLDRPELDSRLFRLEARSARRASMAAEREADDEGGNPELG